MTREVSFAYDMSLTSVTSVKKLDFFNINTVFTKMHTVLYR